MNRILILSLFLIGCYEPTQTTQLVELRPDIQVFCEAVYEQYLSLSKKRFDKCKKDLAGARAVYKSALYKLAKKEQHLLIKPLNYCSHNPEYAYSGQMHRDCVEYASMRLR